MKPAIIFAIVLSVLVMGVAVLITVSGLSEGAKIGAQTEASFAYNGVVQSMKIIDLNGDGADDLFIQTENQVLVYNKDQAPIIDQSFDTPLATTMGDLDGGGREDVLAFHGTAGNTYATLFLNGAPVGDVRVEDVADASRAAIVPFKGQSLAILGDLNGGLVALDATGKVSWRANLSSGDYIRGLDDATVNGTVTLAAANHDGTVGLFDASGKQLWSYSYGGPLRRLRAYDLNGDGTSELLIGGDSGQLVVLNAADGQPLFQQSLGQTITEIREAELNGEPSSREFVVGGKSNGVWAVSYSGEVLWSGSVSERVNEIGLLDVNGNGTEDVLIGDDSGALSLFIAESGSMNSLQSFGGAVERMDVGKFTGSGQVAVASAGAVSLLKVEFTPLGFTRFMPLIVGLFVCLVIFAAAGFIAAIPAKPDLRISMTEQSREALLAQRRMLKETIADVERLQQVGDVTPESYLARLKDLRHQLAENEASMLKGGFKVEVETQTCPNCGGTLMLGMDKCEYCGQVVLH
jgi:outer membrane protein assembly factor BamB